MEGFQGERGLHAPAVDYVSVPNGVPRAHHTSPPLAAKSFAVATFKRGVCKCSRGVYAIDQLGAEGSGYGTTVVVQLEILALPSVRPGVRASSGEVPHRGAVLLFENKVYPQGRKAHEGWW